MQLLDWKRIDRGALIGRAKVLLPCGLEISNIAIFEKDGRRWSQMPSEAMCDAGGQILKDESGKARYRAPLKWSTRELQDGFSEALVALVEAERGL